MFTSEANLFNNVIELQPRPSPRPKPLRTKLQALVIRASISGWRVDAPMFRSLYHISIRSIQLVIPYQQSTNIRCMHACYFLCACLTLAVLSASIIRTSISGQRCSVMYRRLQSIQLRVSVASQLASCTSSYQQLTNYLVI